MRGLLDNKSASDALAYFDENIVAQPKPVKRNVVVVLTINVTEHGVRVPTAEQTSQFAAQLSRLDALDVLKRENADKKNAIEAYCYAMRDKLTDEAFESASTGAIGSQPCSVDRSIDVCARVFSGRAGKVERRFVCCCCCARAATARPHRADRLLPLSSCCFFWCLLLLLFGVALTVARDWLEGAGSRAATAEVSAVLLSRRRRAGWLTTRRL